MRSEESVTGIYVDDNGCILVSGWGWGLDWANGVDFETPEGVLEVGRRELGGNTGSGGSEDVGGGAVDAGGHGFEVGGWYVQRVEYVELS